MSAPARVAVFDAYWSTAGGGETYAAGVASVLSADHDVTLLAHEPVDTRWLGERLGFDLTRVAVREISPTTPLAEASAGYDLLVNLSYRDHGRNGATHGLYVVHFPDRPGDGTARWQRALSGLGRVLGGVPSSVERVRGFHRPDVIRWQQVAWTDGLGVLRVVLPPGGDTTVRLWFGRYVPAGRVREIEVRVDGEPVVRATLGPPRSKVEVVEPLRVDVPVPARPGGALVEIVSDATVAHDDLGNGDRRLLGVPLVGVTTSRSPRAALLARASLLGAGTPGTRWLDGYDVVVANSAFTQRWIERWWHRPSVVLEPPVRLRRPGPKDRAVVSVGRFFAPGRGHAKKQLEMVRAFGALVDAGAADGWELHLAGGCNSADRPYLDEVLAAAAGLPVVVHVDATGAELDELYARASIYWHATGLGEDLDADPVRAEHFGITTVEAMSAGAVPVVMASGGQVDIVRDGIDGLVFHDEAGLVAHTAALMADAERRARLSASAVTRAQHYGVEAFSARLTSLVDGLLGPERGGAPEASAPGESHPAG